MSLQEFVPTPRFEEYREAFRDFYRMERRDDGVLLVAAHTQGGPVQLSVQNHRSLGQMLKTVGADPSNEVLILTASRCSATWPRSAPCTASSTSGRPSTTSARGARTTSTSTERWPAGGGQV
jgi:hypothetical protein